jgi:hypothetical protein
MDWLNQIDNREKLSYSEWLEKLKCNGLDSGELGDRTLVEYWLALSNEDRELVAEVASRRERVLRHPSRLRPWTKRPEDVKAFLTGSIEWANQPLHLASENIESPVQASLLAIALHSILLPAGIVKWSPIDAKSERISILPLFGGLRIDVRGLQAPQPAAHRLFVPDEEAEDLRQQYLNAALLHGVDLVVQYGRTLDWRRWFGELAKGAVQRGLNRAVFAKLYGQLVEDACGLAVNVTGETSYLSRAEILKLIPEPFYFRHEEGWSQGVLWEDPVNRLLCDLGLPRINERVEIDLSNLPIARAKK